MHIVDAQREVRTRYVGGFYGQLISGLLWLGSSALAVWFTHRAAIETVVIGGFFIFPLTEVLRRLFAPDVPWSEDNTLKALGMQIAFVLPVCMLLLLPVTLYRPNWFYPGLMIVLGAHYFPFVFLYGMRMFWVLGGLLSGIGVLIGLYAAGHFSTGAWITGALLLLFAVIGRVSARSVAARAQPT